MSASGGANEATASTRHEGAARQPRPRLLDDREQPAFRARALIEDKANTVLVSAVSFYELDNKMRLKKLDLKPRELRAAVAASGLQTLAITDLHAELAAAFDWEHRDPLDRILAAQARLEHSDFVSLDIAFDTVLHERVW